VELPESVEFNVIITIMNLVFKTVYFILNHTIVSMERVPKLFLHYVWKLHNLTTYVVPDCRLQIHCLFHKETIPHAQDQGHIIYYLASVD